MSPTTPKKHIVFDVVGTITSYSALVDILTKLHGPALATHTITPTHLAYTWLEAAEREYTYLSMSRAYTPFLTVFRSIYHRTLAMIGIPSPLTFSTPTDLDIIIDAFQHKMVLRPGIPECFRILREAGFEIWAFTAGGRERIYGYFTGNELAMEFDHVISCDETRVGKPALESYEALLERWEGEECWFAAAHMWDVSAAKRAGFRGAWCSVWEGEACEGLFGGMDVVAGDFEEMAREIVRVSEQAGKKVESG